MDYVGSFQNPWASEVKKGHQLFATYPRPLPKQEMLLTTG